MSYISVTPKAKPTVIEIEKGRRSRKARRALTVTFTFLGT